MGTDTNGTYSLAARKMADAISEAETSADLAFARSGRRLQTHYSQVPSGTAFIVTNPHRPSLASCQDMVAEHEQRRAQGLSGTDLIVAYDEERWLDDARVDEAAGIGTMAEVEEMLIEAAWELAA